MSYNEKCPICGEINKGLFLKETDGWFICQKCGTEVSNYADGVKPSKIPLYTLERLAQEFKHKKEQLATG